MGVTTVQPRGSKARAVLAVVLVSAVATAMTAVVGLGGAFAAGTGPSAAEQQYGPTNTSPPTISGTPTEGETLTANPGSWSGTGPITFAYQWQRCDQNGGNCSNIVGATAQTYRLTSADVGRTMRVVVTATNATGASSATSAPTAVVQAAGPAGVINLPGGGRSIPATSVGPAGVRLLIDGVRFTPNPVRSRRTTITARFHVSDTRGFSVRGALVFLRSTPLLTTTPGEQATNTAGFVTFRLRPLRTFPLRNGINVQFFVRARRPGDNVLAGISSRRLVQVRTASPR
jgi:hypothetical protein